MNHTRSQRLALTALCVVGGLLSTGCHGTSGGVPAESGLFDPNRKIRAEAYSFNARLRRDGKPTTFKLEVYQTDSLLGLSGRGYLGKGALKGWVSSDSLKVYFPSTRELVYESLSDMATGSECPFPLAGLNALSFFHHPPDSVAVPADLSVKPDYANKKRPKFRVESSRPDCSWVVDLTYDRQDAGWRLRRFEFDNGDGVTLRGVRERYRAGAKVAVKRFQIVPKPGTIRITP